MSRMVSLARRPEDRMGSETALLQGEEYPPGLCLTLTDSELEKMSLSDEGVEVGDLVHLRVMVEVRSVHHDNAGCRIDGRIIAGGVIENESTEDEDDEDEE
jgi:hypothetical protein